MSNSRKREYEDDGDSMLPPSPSGASLPPSSPPAIPFGDDDEDVIQDDNIDDLDEMAEEEAGEDLFDDNM